MVEVKLVKTCGWRRFSRRLRRDEPPHTFHFDFAILLHSAHFTLTQLWDGPTYLTWLLATSLIQQHGHSRCFILCVFRSHVLYYNGILFCLAFYWHETVTMLFRSRLLLLRLIVEEYCRQRWACKQTGKWGADRRPTDRCSFHSGAGRVTATRRSKMNGHCLTFARFQLTAKNINQNGSAARQWHTENKNEIILLITFPFGGWYLSIGVKTQQLVCTWYSYFDKSKS